MLYIESLWDIFPEACGVVDYMWRRRKMEQYF